MPSGEGGIGVAGLGVRCGELAAGVPDREGVPGAAAESLAARLTGCRSCCCSDGDGAAASGSADVARRVLLACCTAAVVRSGCIHTTRGR